MKRFWLFLILLASLALLSSCSGARVLMQTAPSKVKGEAASPPITLQSLEEWELSKADIKQTIEREVYGVMPTIFAAEVSDRKALTDHAYRADISEFRVTANYAIDPAAEQEIEYQAVLVLPKNASPSTPSSCSKTSAPITA